MNDTRRKLIVLAGPTAVGKSALSIKLAKKIGGEIISADSMQVYRGLDIGSAKITLAQKDGIPHYLIDELEPGEPFDVVHFQALAKDAMSRIRSNGHIPILTGGAGFYIRSVVYDTDFSEKGADISFRNELEKKYNPEELHRMLFEVDPGAAQKIHKNNVRRMVRALEFYHQTGKKISEHNLEERSKESPYDFAYFVLYDDRSRIYGRINQRVDKMLESGLEAEVRSLMEMGLNENTMSMKGLGYAEMLSYLKGDIAYEDAVAMIKRNTRHFARRQLTWFRKEKDAIWINIGDRQSGLLTPDEDQKLNCENAIDQIITVLKEKRIV